MIPGNYDRDYCAAPEDEIEDQDIFDQADEAYERMRDDLEESE